MKFKELNERYGDYKVDDEVKDKIIDLLESCNHRTVWDLKIEDRYYFLNEEGVVFESTWDDDETDWDRRNQGNVFLTREKAEFEARRRKVYMQVKRFSYEFSQEEWKREHQEVIYKYYVYYDYEDNSIRNSAVIVSRSNDLYFKSEEDIQKAIKAVGEEDFIKYYLMVK